MNKDDECIQNPINFRNLENLKKKEPNSNIIMNQYLWNNRYKTMNQKPFIWKKQKNKGIDFLKDTYNEEKGDFFTVEKVKQFMKLT